MTVEFFLEAASRYPYALWGLMTELAPWLFLGLFLAGVIEFFFPEKKVQQWLGQGKRFAIWRAAFVGVPLPLCSCGVVPVALSLRRRGASRGATVSFLITTPQSGLDSISATWGLMGAPFAIFRTFLTFVSGLVAGYLVQLTDRQTDDLELHTIDQNQKEAQLSIAQRLFGPSWSIMVSIGHWLVIGILLAALIEVIVPSGYVSGTILAGPLGMFVMASFALPLYVCATASIPLAMEFVAKGFSPGAAFVFLLVGPATNVATALIVKKEIGLRAMMMYLFSILLCALGSGYLIDQYITELPFTGFHDHTHTSVASHVFAGILSVLLAIVLLLPYLKKSFKGDEMSLSNQLQVDGMTCDHCRKSVEKAVGDVEGVTQVSVDLQKGIVEYDGGEQEQIKQAVIAAGYEVQ